MEIQHVINFSGGKDSTALVLWAMEWAAYKNFTPRIVFADTGHEHPITYEYIDTVQQHIGIPIERISADFSKQLRHKKQAIRENWGDCSPEHVFLAKRALKASGVPFLDLCKWKGRFPSTLARFCSAELKHMPVLEQVILPMLKHGYWVVSWQGIRADESKARSSYRKFERDDHPRWYNYRPLLKWTVDDVFALHRRHGLKPNPLYYMGMSRVGCMPCIHARKNEIKQIADRFPEEIDRAAYWEWVVSICSKRGAATFFAPNKTPGPHRKDPTLPTPDINAVVAWSRDGEVAEDEQSPESCSSLYGLCE